MIRDLIGVPFAWRGRTRSGADCLGLAVLAQRELGREASDPWQHFAGDAEGEARELGEQIAAGRAAQVLTAPPDWQHVGAWPVPFAELELGDVLEHNVDGVRGHVTIVAEDGFLLMTGEAFRHGSYLMAWPDFLQQHGDELVNVWRCAA